MKTVTTSVAGASAAVLTVTAIGQIVDHRPCVQAGTADDTAYRTAVREAADEAAVRAAQETCLQTTVSFRAPSDPAWTPADDRRFHRLAVKESLRTITPDEAAELQTLVHVRRKVVYPRTPQQIMRSESQKALARDLETVLRRHVSFLHPKG